MYAYHEMHDRKDPDLLYAYQDFFPKRVSVIETGSIWRVRQEHIHTQLL
jgi:hypothetical protein